LGGRAAARVQPRRWLLRRRPAGRRPRRRRRRRAGRAREGSPVGRRIGVLVSGEGSNLQALLDEGLSVAAVAANTPVARALERAHAAGVPAEAFPLERDTAMADWLAAHGVELVVCAGYMHLLRPCFLERFPQRVVNVHPALLPAFPGARAVEDAL